MPTAVFKNRTSVQSSISKKRKFTDRWHHLPIGRQLLLVVSSVLAMFVLAFLAYDYRVRMKRHLDEKRIALTEEAKTLYESILFVQPNGSEGIQDLVDNVCARMNTSDSPGHQKKFGLDSLSFLMPKLPELPDVDQPVDLYFASPFGGIPAP